MSSNANKLNSHVAFYNITFCNKCGWFCDVFSNTLCKVDTDTSVISIEAMIPFDGDTRPFQYGFIEKVGDLLVLAPRGAAVILIYNIIHKTFQRVEIKAEIIERIGKVNLFSGVEVCENNAYLIPGRFPGIIKLNLITLELTYLEDWYDLLLQRIPNFEFEKVVFAQCYRGKNNKIYLPCWQKNIIMVFDLKAEEYFFLEVSIPDAALSGLCIINDEIWAASKNSNIIVKINEEGKEADIIVVEALKEAGIIFLIQCENFLYVIPLYDEQLIRIDLETKKCDIVGKIATENVDIPREFIIAQNRILSCVKDPEGRIWMYSMFDGKIYQLNLQGDVEIFDADVKDETEINKRIDCYLKQQLLQGNLWESRQYGLKEFFVYLQTQREIEESGEF